MTPVAFHRGRNCRILYQSRIDPPLQCLLPWVWRSGYLLCCEIGRLSPGATCSLPRRPARLCQLNLPTMETITDATRVRLHGVDYGNEATAECRRSRHCGKGGLDIYALYAR